MVVTTQSSSTDANISSSTATLSVLISISTHHHLPIKLTPTTFLSWRAHLCALLNGFALSGHIDGSTPSPDPATHPEAASRWFQQDQLLLAAILDSVSSKILPILSSATISATAYNTLSRAFASTLRAHVMFLKTSLTKATIGSKSMAEYVNHVKSLNDELSLIDAPIHDDDLTLYIVKGLDPKYREIVSSVRTHETLFRFEELRDRLIEHEAYIKQLEAATSTLVATTNIAQSSTPSPRPQSTRGGRAPSYSSHDRGGRGYPPPSYSSFHDASVTCQICGHRNHTAPYCRHLQATANFAHSPTHSPSLP